MEKQNVGLLNFSKTGIVAGLYVAVSMLLAPISFGAFQFRLSEIFNQLGIFNKRYIFAVTLGCAIANMFSPLGVIDVIVGSLSTFMMLSISYLVTKKIKGLKTKFIINALVCSTLGMFPIALELVAIFKLPLPITYFGLVQSELVAMTLGGVIIYHVNKRMNLAK